MTDRYAPTPKEVATLESWVNRLKPVIEKYPILSTVDLIVEGGVGNGRIMPHLARTLFPEALYIGTDLYEELGFGPRYYGQIEQRAIQDATVENEQPTEQMTKAIIQANCFDMDLIRDIAQRTGKNNPVLVSFNALAALAYKDINSLETKRGEDRIPLSVSVGPTSPYVGQLHVTHLGGFWDDPEVRNYMIYSPFYELEQAAQSAGWQTERLDIGILAARPTA